MPSNQKLFAQVIKLEYQAVGRARRRRLKLGLVSTGYEDVLYRDVKELNLESSVFDVIVGVDTPQCMKPIQTLSNTPSGN